TGLSDSEGRPPGSSETGCRHTPEITRKKREQLPSRPNRTATTVGRAWRESREGGALERGRASTSAAASLRGNTPPVEALLAKRRRSPTVGVPVSPAGPGSPQNGTPGCDSAAPVAGAASIGMTEQPRPRARCTRATVPTTVFDENLSRRHRVRRA